MKIETVTNLDFYTEGPGLDGFGNLFFTTLTGGVIMKMDPSGEISEWSRLQCPNGQRILDNGDHLVCETGMKSILQLNSQGNIVRTLVNQKCAGISFSSPNDLAIDSEGGVYFTDSVRHSGKVFYISSSGDERLLTKGMDYPNGIALSHDEKNVFVAESYTNRILVLELSEPGICRKPPRVFVDLPKNQNPIDRQNMPYTANLPDGIAFDDEGNLWVAHYGMGALQVVDQSGGYITSVPTGIPATSNLCFTKDYKNIYVSGGSGEPGPGMIHKVILE